MSSAERVWRSLEGQEPDRVPLFEFEVQIADKIIGEPPFSADQIRSLREKGKERRAQELQFRYKARLWRKLGYDMISVPGDLLPVAREELPDVAYLGGCGRVSPMPGSMADIETIRQFYYEEKSIRKQCREMTKKAVEGAKREIDSGFRIIRGGLDDMAGKEGPFLAPRFYERFIFPNLRKLARTINNRGAKLLVHSDGDLMPLLDGLVGSGIDALHSLDPSSGMKIENIKDGYGDCICLFGNVDCAWTLTREKPSRVSAETRYCIEKAAPGGGYVLSSSNVIHSAVPLENLMAMLETGKRYGKYR
jgi:uroporphyrinogen decarboxylase